MTAPSGVLPSETAQSGSGYPTDPIASANLYCAGAKVGVIATVAAGSALGGVARYLIGSWAQNGSHAFPWGTLVVNLTGCLVLGILVRWLGDVADSAQWRLFLAIGFCGSYTTFSTFSYEAVQLLRDRDWTAAVGYLSASMIGGLLALVVGLAAADWLLKARG